MVDIWDLGRYVEDHPEEYEQRWRLAKKLYLACEYRLALEHLQILRNEWSRKLNVVRYLSATLYRLGRYQEAIVELEEAIDTWPEEVGLREQLARVLEVSGRELEAADVWQQLADIAPDHPIAERAAKRLRGEIAPAAPEHEELHIRASDSGIDLAPTRICPNCGAQNTAEFDRCWQCHGALTGSASPSPFAEPIPAAVPLREEKSPRGAIKTAAILAALVAIAYGGYLAYENIPRGGATLPVPVGPTLYGELFQGMLTVRLAMGAVLILIWPLVLALAIRRVPSDAPGGGVILFTGVLLAALAFGVLWMPLELYGVAFILLGVVSLALIAALFDVSARDTFVVWLLQGVLVAVAALLTFGAVEGFASLPSLPAAFSYAAAHGGDKAEAEHKAPEAQLNATYAIKWKSSGSKWLDEKLGGVYFLVKSPTTSPSLAFDFKEGARTVIFEEIKSTPFESSYSILTGESYELHVRGSVEQKGSPVELSVFSHLEPQITVNPQPQQPAPPTPPTPAPQS